MSSEFVRYAPEIETIDPHIDELLAQIIGFWEKKGRESPRTEGIGRVVRAAYAKSFGLVKAEVEILADVPAAYAQGIYAKPGRHGALIRFSSTSGHLGTDAQLGPGLVSRSKYSMLTDPSWSKTSRARPHSTSCLRTVQSSSAIRQKHCLFIQEIVVDLPHYLAGGTVGIHQLLTDFLTGKGALKQPDWAWEELLAFVRTAAQTPVRNLLVSTYWTMAAVRHGDYAAKIRVAPAADGAAHLIHAELDLTSGPEVFHPTLADELQARAFNFDLQTQLCTDLDTMPVNDVTVEWFEKLSPFVAVGRVHLPRQDISGPENFEKSDPLAFNQWRVTSGHRPLGEIMNVRRIYSASAKVRRTLNHQSQTEPTSADSVLP